MQCLDIGGNNVSPPPDIFVFLDGGLRAPETVDTELFLCLFAFFEGRIGEKRAEAGAIKFGQEAIMCGWA